ncbi:unnamed protein product [Cylicostephanus goldi]|uniref:Uncharacterized protein n=1 Tax=Cylicostephanus goldi TaxID=71465 RepID=A0A3P6SB57_CYLGO|nr:unnamed protein product [Cylicostephanus goldi]
MKKAGNLLFSSSSSSSDESSSLDTTNPPTAFSLSLLVVCSVLDKLVVSKVVVDSVVVDVIVNFFSSGVVIVGFFTSVVVCTSVVVTVVGTVVVTVEDIVVVTVEGASVDSVLNGRLSALVDVTGNEVDISVTLGVLSEVLLSTSVVASGEGVEGVNLVWVWDFSGAAASILFFTVTASTSTSPSILTGTSFVVVVLDGGAVTDVLVPFVLASSELAESTTSVTTTVGGTVADVDVFAVDETEDVSADVLVWSDSAAVAVGGSTVIFWSVIIVGSVVVEVLVEADAVTSSCFTTSVTVAPSLDSETPKVVNSCSVLVTDVVVVVVVDEDVPMVVVSVTSAEEDVDS